MQKRRKKSTIDLLPDEIQAKIAELSKRHTLDEILAHLKQLDVDVSRSALGRHIQKLPDIIERINRTRIIGEALVEKFGDKPDSKSALANIEVTHALAMEVMTKCQVDPKTGAVSDPNFTPMELMLIAKTFDHLASAKKKDVEVTLKAREEAAKQAVSAVKDNAEGLGLSLNAVDTLRKAISTRMFGEGKL